MDMPIPRDQELERAVVGMLMLAAEYDEREGLLEVTRLTSGDFTDPDLVRILRAMLDLTRRGDPVDLLSLNRACPDLIHVLAELAGSQASTAYLHERVTQLKRVTARRKAHIEAAKFAVEVATAEEPAAMITAHAETLFGFAAAIQPGAGPVDAAETEARIVPKGISSGFLTHDWNDGGFKPGKMTVLVGVRGQGKTTISRQMLMAVAMQGVRTMTFAGEASVGEEKAYLAQLCAEPGEILRKTNIGGRVISVPSDRCFKRFDERYKGLISMCDMTISERPERLFRTLVEHMERLADAGVYLFVLDSMMVLNTATGNKKFDEQKRITETLKQFAVRNGTHVLLIAHPKKGEGFQSVSGAGEQENLVDTILRYVRISEESRAKNLAYSGLAEADKAKVSAMLLNEKIRDRGEQKTAYLEWDAERGAVIELSRLAAAETYQKNGYWTRPSRRFGAEDLPSDTDAAAEARQAYKD